MGVRVEGLRLRYGEKVALDGIDLTIGDGEFMVILGSSGSGKTTLLRCIAGLIQPTEGRVYIDDVDVTDLYPSDRNVAMVFQNFALYPHMTVFDNISLNLKLKKTPRKEIQEKVSQVARMLKIEDHLKKYPKQLSGGEQQRVGIARAMVRDPSLFLMDEPLSNLDAKLRHEMLGELRTFHERVGKTILYVCHDQDEAVALADRIAIIDHGRIVQMGKPMDLYDHPSNTFVASFLGNPPMNLLKCRLSREGSRTRVLLGSVEVANLGTHELPEGDAVIGVRPENLIVDSGGPIRALFNYSVMAGSSFEINVTVDDTPVKAVIQRNENDPNPLSGIRFNQEIDLRIGG
ncbi:MAG: ABC transporter ATP-binding protein, partial [Thermoplasmataceae archaeon]